MFGKKKAAKAEDNKFQKAAYERATQTPFDNSYYYVTGDYALHYRVDEAEGKEKGKFFILHGFWLNTTFYDELVECLTKEGYTCYRVDMPDFGYSTRETVGIDFRKPKDLIKDMLTELDDGKGFIIYGHSMGGSIAMEVAAEDKKHVKALILNAPMFMRDSNEKQAERFTSARMKNMLTMEANLVTKLNKAVKAFIYLMTWDLGYSKNFDPAKFTTPFTDPDAGEALGYFTGHVKKPDTKALKNISVPVLYVAAGRDLFVAGRVVRKIKKSLPKKQTTFVKLRGAGHCFPQSDAKKATALALKFLKK